MRRYLAQLSAYVTAAPLRQPHARAPAGVPGEHLRRDHRPRYRGSGLYNEVYHPQGMEDQITLNLSDSTPGKWHCIAASRHRRGFGAVDRERLAILRPHLIAAVVRARALARLHANEQRALEQLDVLAPGGDHAGSGRGGARGVLQSARPGDAGGVVRVPAAANRRRAARGARGLAARTAAPVGGRRVAGEAASAVRAGWLRRTAAGRQPARRHGRTRRHAGARRAPGRAAFHRAPCARRSGCPNDRPRCCIGSRRARGTPTSGRFSGSACRP